MPAKKKEIIMVKKFVYAEPELWALLKRMNGDGSMSEAMRRYAKDGLKAAAYTIKNIQGIDWNE